MTTHRLFSTDWYYLTKQSFSFIIIIIWNSRDKNLKFIEEAVWQLIFQQQIIFDNFYFVQI